jgi:branched-chain amino acid transport system substrate-binding protein
MKTNLMRKLPFILVLALVVAILAPLALAQEDGDTITIAPGDDVVLGLASILSGEGLVPLGDDITRGVELAILASEGVITVGDAEFPVVLDIQDDQCSAEGGQAIANYFVSQENVVAIVGPTCSSACRAAGPIFDEAGFTMISSSCTAVDLTAEDTGFASFNRTTANDGAQGPAAAEFIYNELGFTTIATIHDSSPYGEGLVESMTARFEELGGTVAVADAINVGDTDFRNLLDTVASEEVELIYFGGFPAEAARLAEQRADVGLEDTPMMGADGILSPEFVNLAGDASEGVYASAPAAAASEEYDAFVELYTETYETEPTAAFHAYSFDAALMLLSAIEETGTIDDNGNLVLSRSAIAEYIRSFGAEESVIGLSGELACDGTGECALGGIGMFQVQDGAFARLEMMMEAE